MITYRWEGYFFRFIICSWTAIIGDCRIFNLNLINSIGTNFIRCQFCECNTTAWLFLTISILLSFHLYWASNSFVFNSRPVAVICVIAEFGLVNKALASTSEPNNTIKILFKCIYKITSALYTNSNIHEKKQKRQSQVASRKLQTIVSVYPLSKTIRYLTVHNKFL